MVLSSVAAAVAPSEPPGGALAGQRPRVIVSTDMGGCDPDDFQSMVHLLLYADVLDIEGLVASLPGKGRPEDILEAIAAYEEDYPSLVKHSWESRLKSAGGQDRARPLIGSAYGLEE